MQSLRWALLLWSDTIGHNKSQVHQMFEVCWSLPTSSLKNQVRFAVKAIFTQEKNKQTYHLCLNDMFPKTAKNQGQTLLPAPIKYTFWLYNPRFWHIRSRCFASPYGFDCGLRPPLRMTYKHSLARVILSERSESNCEAVRGVTEQDLVRS